MRKNKLPGEKSVIAYLKENLTRERIGHTMAVAYLASKLARKHGLNPARVRMAALLHDSAKNWSKQRLVRYAKSRRLPVPDLLETCRRRPRLTHAYAGASVAAKVFGITDREILSAISKHTLGNAKMNRFEKCIYMADLAEPGRKFPEAKELRNLAMRDLDRAFVRGVGIKIIYAIKDGRWIHPESVRVWNHWMKKTR